MVLFLYFLKSAYLLEIFMTFGISITHGWGKEEWLKTKLCALRLAGDSEGFMEVYDAVLTTFVCLVFSLLKKKRATI